VTRAPLAALLLASPLALAAGPAITPFSTGAPSASLPAPWRVQGVPHAQPSELRTVLDDGVTVLRAHAARAAGAAIHPTHLPSEGTTISWRWKVDRVLATADMDTKHGDDFAARVYVFFDVPLQAVPLAQRAKMKLARLLYGAELPTAAICYVWDNRHAPGTSRWSAYSDRVRVVVLENAAGAGHWKDETRDVAADFRAAFGSQWKGPVPAVSGVAMGNDTDQTGETVTAWFGDVRLETRP
jgi:hypothetical protein